jgi:hypothetical protein
MAKIWRKNGENLAKKWRKFGEKMAKIWHGDLDFKCGGQCYYYCFLRFRQFSAKHLAIYVLENQSYDNIFLR